MPRFVFSTKNYFSDNFVSRSISLVLIASAATSLNASNAIANETSTAETSVKTKTATSKSLKTSNVTSVTVFAAGDIADCRKKAVADTMAAKTANIIEAGLAADSKAIAITLGDNTYPVGNPEEFTKCYEPTWGRFKARTLPSPGNHDYDMPAAQGYYNYFGELAGPEKRGYYSSKVGQWQIISLNSNIEGPQMQAQLHWLKDELSNKHQTRCTLAFWHHPAFSSGGHGNNAVMQAVWKLLAEAKADIVLAGHDHDYERFAPLNADGLIDQKNGIRSFVVGTGGAKLTPMFFPKVITEARDNSTAGVLKLTLHDKNYEWEFIPVDGSGFTDKGAGVCH
ncbi:hypothetical protein AAKU61_002103 [Undibacterium sp. GrIS 1.2]|uniref:metallophosphoesterase family protein n=1 Tax=Undibacterium sp. GrIS 1.2 TaxID=3143933 RepID=UPI003397C96A